MRSAGLLLALIPATANAALPPAAQRLREIEAVVRAAAPRLADPIDAVRRVAAGDYLVVAGRCTARVRVAAVMVRPLAGQRPGPLEISAGVEGAPRCR